MSFLIQQMLFYLIISCCIGFLMGWLIKAILSRRQLKHLERTWRINLASRDQELEKLKK